MKNLLLTIGVVAVGYALYRQWAMKNDKSGGVVVKSETDKAIKNAKTNSMSFVETPNAETFRLMKGQFNAEESATVAPSIKARIGIF